MNASLLFCFRSELVEVGIAKDEATNQWSRSGMLQEDYSVFHVFKQLQCCFRCQSVENVLLFWISLSLFDESKEESGFWFDFWMGLICLEREAPYAKSWKKDVEICNPIKAREYGRPMRALGGWSVQYICISLAMECDEWIVTWSGCIIWGAHEI